MAKFGAAIPVGATTFTPSVGAANWVLESTSTTQLVRAEEFSMGGELTSSTAMRTRIARDSVVGAGTRTAITVGGKFDGSYIASPGNAAFISSTYGTTQPTIVAGALLPFSWNANGGFIRWLAAPGEEIIMTTATSIEARADIGTGQSSYGLVWSEF